MPPNYTSDKSLQKESSGGGLARVMQGPGVRVPERFAEIEDPDLMKSIYKPMFSIYEKHYLADPILGKPENWLRPPPITKLYAIYGINLETETFLLLKKGEKGELVLDPSAKVPMYKTRGGVGTYYVFRAAPRSAVRFLMATLLTSLLSF